MTDSGTTEKLLMAKVVGEVLSLAKRERDIEEWISMDCCSQKECVARREEKR